MKTSNKKNDPVVVTCYGKTETWESRANAMAFYMGAMAASEGSEFDRYKNIFDALVAGKKTCNDGDEWMKETKKTMQRVAVTWEMCGYIDVEAESLKEAMDMVKENPDDFSLPVESDYVDGSFTLSTDDIGEMEAMCKIDEM